MAAAVLAIAEDCTPIGQSDPAWFELGFEEGMGSERPLVNGKIVVRSRRGAMVLFSPLYLKYFVTVKCAVIVPINLSR